MPGSGDRYRVFIKTTITSGAGAVKVANASDIMAGIATLAQDAGDTSVSFETASDTDTVTTNGTTTGGLTTGAGAGAGTGAARGCALRRIR